MIGAGSGNYGAETVIQEYRDPRGRVVEGNQAASGQRGSIKRYVRFEQGIADHLGIAISPLDTEEEKEQFRATAKEHILASPLTYYKHVLLPALKLFPPKVLERVIDRIFPPLELQEDIEDLKVLREIVEEGYKGGKSLDEIESDLATLADAAGGEGHS